MEGSFVIQDLKDLSPKWPHRLEGWDRMFTEYPVLVKDVLQHPCSAWTENPRTLMQAA